MILRTCSDTLCTYRVEDYGDFLIFAAKWIMHGCTHRVVCLIGYGKMKQPFRSLTLYIRAVSDSCRLRQLTAYDIADFHLFCVLCQMIARVHLDAVYQIFLPVFTVCDDEKISSQEEEVMHQITRKRTKLNGCESKGTFPSRSCKM